MPNIMMIFMGLIGLIFRAYYIGDEDPTSPLHEWAIKEVFTNQYVISGDSKYRVNIQL